MIRRCRRSGCARARAFIPKNHHAMKNIRLSHTPAAVQDRPRAVAKGRRASPRPSCPMRAREPVDLATEPAFFRLPGGVSVVVRPIRPHDAGALQAYVRGLSVESRRNRFLGILSELAPTELARITRMDRPPGLALLAFVANGRQNMTQDMLIGEAIQAIAPGAGRCEIALSVRDDWQRRGLGTRLVRNMECRARMLGAHVLIGDVLRTNTAMKWLARKRGFAIASPFTDARLVEIVKDLSVPQSGPPCGEDFAPPPSIAA
jgi:GNAT superfamily N-acetyltransferase